MNPFQKGIDLLNGLQHALPVIGWAFILVAIITCGIMFTASDRMSEKAKPWLVRIFVGSVLIGGASIIQQWLQSGF